MVTVITCTIREEMASNVIANFRRQSGVPEKELIVILNKNNMKFTLQGEGDSNIRIFQIDESATLGECLNFGCAQARYDIIAKFDDDDYYGPAYLSRSLKCMQDTRAGLVGKAAIYVYFKNDQLLTLYRPRTTQQFLKKPLLAGGTLLFQKQILQKVQFQPLNLGEDTQFQLDCLNRKIPVFAGLPHDYALIRYGVRHRHTWVSYDQDFQQQCHRVAVTDSFGEWVDAE